jgi:succinate dehydrogenase / fumarate reductase iron-sulfur subunit
MYRPSGLEHSRVPGLPAVSAKVSQFALLPQGRPEATQRVLAMLREMDICGFGNCTNHRVCENACPKEVSITHIARFNREFLKAALFARTK